MAVLHVRDAQKSSEFYCGVLDFREVSNLGGKTIFLQAADSTNDHDLGLFTLGSGAGDSGAGQTSVGLYHLAWEVDTLSELQRISEKLQQVGALGGASDHGTTKALYARDPDGPEFEVSWVVRGSRISKSVQSVGVVAPGMPCPPLKFKICSAAEFMVEP